MTHEQRAAAKARCEAATEGEWIPEYGDLHGRVHEKSCRVLLAIWSSLPDFVLLVHRWAENCTAMAVSDNDLAFIAHVRQDLPDALAELDRRDEYEKKLEAKNEELTRTLSDLGRQYNQLLFDAAQPQRGRS